MSSPQLIFKRGQTKTKGSISVTNELEKESQEVVPLILSQVISVTVLKAEGVWTVEHGMSHPGEYQRGASVE